MTYTHNPGGEKQASPHDRLEAKGPSGQLFNYAGNTLAFKFARILCEGHLGLWRTSVRRVLAQQEGQ